MYPANYGYITQTNCDDKDPLDILVLCSIDVFPRSLIEAKVIGVMHIVNNGEQDDKFILLRNYKDCLLEGTRMLINCPPFISIAICVLTLCMGSV